MFEFCNTSQLIVILMSRIVRILDLIEQVTMQVPSGRNISKDLCHSHWVFFI